MRKLGISYGRYSRMAWERINYGLATCAFIVLIVAFTASLAFAHPGGTASDGCHYCRTNCAKWGETTGARHCHGRTRPPEPEETDNGFGLLFNWNLLGDGDHEVAAFVDGVELDRAAVTVTTLGAEFVQEVEGTCDFPEMGETVTLVWQQSKQNFVIAEGSVPRGPIRTGTAGVGYLENPGPNSFQSGIGVISGWVCEAEAVELEIGAAGRQAAAYGTERLDTLGACGDTDNGFGLLFNWNLLGEGEHAVVAYADAQELGRATVRVTTLGAEFLRDVEGECMVEDFPDMGRTVTLEWQQNSQNFVITDVE